MKKIVSVLTVFLMLFTLVSPIVAETKYTITVTGLPDDSYVTYSNATVGSDGTVSAVAGENVVITFVKNKGDYEFLKWVSKDVYNYEYSCDAYNNSCSLTLKSIDSDHTIAAKYLKSDESATNYYVRNIYTMLDGSIKKTETLYQTSELPSDTVYIDPVMPGTGSNDPLYLLLGDLVNCFDFASHKIYDYSNKDNPIELPSDAGGSHPVGTQYYFNGADGDRLVEFYFEQNLGNDEYRLKTECDYPISFYKGATQIYSAKVGETFTIKAENTLDNGNTFKYWIGQNTNMEKVTFTDAKSNETTVTITSPGDVYFTAVYGPESATVTRLTERTVLDDNISAMEAFRLGSINTVGATVPDFRIENGVSYVLTKITLESSDGIFKEEYSTDKLELMGQNLGLYNMFADNTLIPNGYPEMTYTLYYKNAISINQQDAMKKALNFEPVDNVLMKLLQK